MSLPDPRTIDFDMLDVTEEADIADGEYIGTVYGRVTGFGGRDNARYACFITVPKLGTTFAVILESETRPSPWDVLRIKVEGGDAEIVEVL